MRRLATMALLTAVLMAALPAVADDYTYKPKRSVFGKYDMRTIEDSRVYPWRAIGRFNMAGRGHCTATVVAPRIVATAAHCVVNRLIGGYMPPDSLHFVAGWDRGDYIFHSIAAEIHPAPGHVPGTRPTTKSIVNDWALVVLVDDPAPVTGIIQPTPYTDDVFRKLRKADTIFIQAGYSGDKGQVLTAHQGCPMWGFTKGRQLAEHGCQAVPGDSGSPIFYRDGDQYRLIGVHSAHDKASGKGFAVPSRSFIEALEQLSRRLAG